jgi:hypothetical protein
VAQALRIRLATNFKFEAKRLDGTAHCELRGWEIGETSVGISLKMRESSAVAYNEKCGCMKHEVEVEGIAGYHFVPMDWNTLEISVVPDGLCRSSRQPQRRITGMLCKILIVR